MANTIFNVLVDHFLHCVIPGSEEDAELSRIYIVFLRHAEGCDDTTGFSDATWQGRVTDALVKRYRNAIPRVSTDAKAALDAEGLERAIRYVDSYWVGNVRLVDKKGLSTFSIPTFLPLAQLVQAVEGTP